MRRTARILAGVMAVWAVLSPPHALAQDTTTAAAPAATVAPAAPEKIPGGLGLELNRLEQNGEACRATFVASNAYASDLEETAFELALFDKAGLVNLITVFDFGALPAGKTLVKRFDLKGLRCEDISRVLLNAAKRCHGAGVDLAACAAGLTTSNRAGVTFGR